MKRSPRHWNSTPPGSMRDTFIPSTTSFSCRTTMRCPAVRTDTTRAVDAGFQRMKSKSTCGAPSGGESSSSAKGWPRSTGCSSDLASKGFGTGRVDGTAVIGLFFRIGGVGRLSVGAGVAAAICVGSTGAMPAGTGTSGWAGNGAGFAAAGDAAAAGAAPVGSSGTTAFPVFVETDGSARAAAGWLRVGGAGSAGCAAAPATTAPALGVGGVGLGAGSGRPKGSRADLGCPSSSAAARLFARRSAPLSGTTGFGTSESDTADVASFAAAWAASFCTTLSDSSIGGGSCSANNPAKPRPIANPPTTTAAARQFESEPNFANPPDSCVLVRLSPPSRPSSSPPNGPP